MNKKTSDIYEIGIHIVPNVGNIEGKFKEVASLVRDVISQETPTMTDLAYSIKGKARNADSTYNKYSEAYFGSIKFRASKEDIKKIEQTLTEDEEVLRYLLVNTIEGDTRVGDDFKEETDEEEERKENSDYGTVITEE